MHTTLSWHSYGAAPTIFYLKGCKASPDTFSYGKKINKYYHEWQISLIYQWNINSTNVGKVLLPYRSTFKPLGKVLGRYIRLYKISLIYTHPAGHLSMLTACSNCPDLHLVIFTTELVVGMVNPSSSHHNPYKPLAYYTLIATINHATDASSQSININSSHSPSLYGAIDLRTDVMLYT